MGKSFWIREHFPQAPVLDLLKTDVFAAYASRPSLLRERFGADPPRLIVIDEVQKVPALLDEVHWLIENRDLVFALCGSSARKVRRGHANLLGGRAVRYELFGLVSNEVEAFSLDRFLQHGYLPRHYLADDPRRRLRAYVDDYLKEEIAAEGLVRNLPAFSTFLWAAALADTELVNYTNIARECGVTANGVKGYYEILTDTLLGRFLPAFTRRPKRRVIQAPKFYLADVGVVNHLARRGRVDAGGELYGKALENFVFHELTAYLEYRERFLELTHWRLASGVEVDFVIGDVEAAVEVKASGKIAGRQLSGLRALRDDHPRAKRLFLACLEPKRRVTADGIEIVPVEEFCERLWGDELF